MSIPIVIQGTQIDFPADSQSPDWSSGVIEFAQATATALSGVVGTFDVAPQVFNIDSQNPTSTNVNIPNLAFSTSQVRSAIINITCHRKTISTGATEVTEADILIITYNASNSPGMLWELTREGTGDASVTYNITDTGQVQFITGTLTGSSHTGILAYSAKALLNS